MDKKIFIINLLIFILILSGCNRNQADIIQNKNGKLSEKNDKSNEEIIKDEKIIIEEVDELKNLMDNMTMDEKIGQLLIIGFNSKEMNDNVREMIEKNHIGGIILFKDNIKTVEQTIELLNTFKETNKENPLPLFLSIDEEGGRVSRLPKPFIKLPSAKKIGYINNKDISFEYGKILGNRINTLGFNMNFAPVMDINSNPKNPVIGDRAFGSTIDVVVDNSIQVMKGISSENIIPVIKHFPGHGDTKTDSHIDIPMVFKGIDELEELELIPFIRAIEIGADSIMIGHILFTELDEDNPATLSNTIINEILRNKLSYDGVIISDDMAMGAVAKNYNIEDAVIKFFKAGGDIALVCHDYEVQLRVIDKIKEEIEKGNIKQEEIDEKVYRIIKLKKKYNIEDNIISETDIENINMKTKKFLQEIKGL